MHHRLGHRPARHGGHQRRPRGPPRHHRRVDRRALGHPRATHRRHGVVAGHRGRPARRSSARAWRRSRRRPAVLATCTPDLAVPATSAAVHHALGLVGRRLRRQRRLRGLRLRAGRRPRRPRARRRPTGCSLIGADCVSLHHRPRRPGHRRALRRRRRAVVCSRRATATGCSASTSASTAARTTCSPAPTAATCRWRAKRSSAGPCGSRSSPPATRSSRARLGADDVALFVPHQANLRIIEAAAARLGIPMERVAVVLDRTGNTSSASIPLALADAADAGRLRAGRRACSCRASAPAWPGPASCAGGGPG